MKRFISHTKVTLPIACLFLALTGSAQSSNLIDSTLHNQDYAEAMKNTEFEKFLIRYATHYPSATIVSATQIAEKSLSETCLDLSFEKAECYIKLNANNIENLLTEVAISKLKLSKDTENRLDVVDQELTMSGVANIGDKYTRFIQFSKDELLSHSQPTSTLSNDGTKLKINTFDSALGCIDTKHITSAETVEQLDLRDNNGGDIKCTLETLSKFLPAGNHHVATVYTIRGEEDLWVTGQLPPNNNSKELKVNKNTASSAEIFAIALERSGWKVDGLPMMNKRSIQARFETNFGYYHLTIGKFSPM
ncbi:S41 family peptidase [Vibrio coralliirubri]|uniref:S41 family peptidase n=1 Tax=Vibrio coralliirubri TaxID=1516159 RepID=UPI0022853258|nr:S41 family peptidase [Vibrio coralliirubri]MCY9865127.1 S41 family peptidase [Vibrio coralliirubri]